MASRQAIETVHETTLDTSERQISALGGGILAAVGGIALSQGKAPGILLAALGGVMVYTGVRGELPLIKTHDEHRHNGNHGKFGLSKQVSVPYGHGVRVERSITINRPTAELYEYWHNFENLARFMKHIESVTVEDYLHSHWVVKGPAEKIVEWDAEIVNDVMNERIAWRSLPDSDVENAGSVIFKPAPAGRGTEVKIEIEYVPPMGKAGKLFAKMFAGDPQLMIAEDIYRFKQLMETGETASTEGQPTCRD